MEEIELQMFKLKFKDDFEKMKKYFVFENIENFSEVQQKENLKECYELLHQSGLLNLERILFE